MRLHSREVMILNAISGPRAHLAKAALLLLFLLPAPAQNERRLMVYAPATVYAVPLTNRGGQEYVSLSDILEPLGEMEAKANGNRWKLNFSGPGAKKVNAEFRDGSPAGKIRDRDISLSGNFFIENGRGYIPMHNVGDIAAALTGQITTFREGSGRLLVGSSGVKYSMDLRLGDIRAGTPPRLMLNFQSAVNPTISTEPGRIRLTFRRDPIVSSGPENVALGNPVIMSATFSDSSGVPQITVNATAPLAASFVDGNKTIVLTPTHVVASTTPMPAQPWSSTPTPSSSTPMPGTPVPQESFTVVIDPAHGGEDRGAAITQNIVEKDVTLTLARRLQHELQNRGINATLLRHGDTMINLDDRAIAANVSRARIYIAVHASGMGSGVRVFTAMMSPGGPQSRRFVSWDTAQSGFLDLSSQAAGSVAAELGNRKIAVTALTAPLRPMQNVAGPAIAIEVAPPPGRKVEQLTAADYQQGVASAVAQGILAVRSRMAGAR